MSEHLPIDTLTGKVRRTSSLTGNSSKPLDFRDIVVIGIGGGGGASARAVTPLVIGQSYIDVVFDTAEPDNTWVLLECSIVNTTDPSPLNIAGGIITAKTTAGFRLQLNGMPDTANYALHWAIAGFTPAPFPATSYTLSGPASGAVGVASSNFTVQLPAGGTLAAPMTVTPSDGAGGVFTPATVSLTTANPSKTFTYTPSSYGSKTISTTNNKSLTDPIPLTFTSVASTYTLSGPSGGSNLVASTNFTVALPVGGVVTGTVTVTPSSGGGGGSFTPSTVGLTTAAPSATFTYTPASSGAKTISVANDGGLTNPGNLTYTVTGVALLTTLISYWKLDETGGNTRNDSVGTNHLLEVGGAVSHATAGKINNCLQTAMGPAGNCLRCASNTSLQATGEFTISCWVTPTSTDIGSAGYTSAGIVTKADLGGSGADYGLVMDGTVGFQFSGAQVGALPTPGIWYHLVAWYDATLGKYFLRVNDTTTYEATGTLSTSATPFVVGGYAYIPNVYYTFPGYIDEVGFWKRKLTAGEITALYNGGAGLPFSSFT